jgi:hypothetical protein
MLPDKDIVIILFEKRSWECSLTCMSMEVPVVTKNNPSSKPLNGLMSASICVRKFVSARRAPARKAPSYIGQKFNNQQIRRIEDP